MEKRIQKNAMALLAREITFSQNKLLALRRELSRLVLSRHILFRRWREKTVGKKIRATKLHLDKFLAAQRTLKEKDTKLVIKLLNEMLKETPYLLNALGGFENGSFVFPIINPHFDELSEAKRQLSKEAV